MTVRLTFFLTLLALIAFAGNSVLTRMALIDGGIDVVPFTAIRVLSGAGVLALLVGVKTAFCAGRWNGAAALLGYAALFTLAYLQLDTGVGALLLFASVQIAMIGWGLFAGERFDRVQGLGVIMALAGLIWLLLPGQARPNLVSAGLMIGSGLCWGVYSLLGRRSGRPTEVTTGNFVRATLLGIPLIALSFIFGADMSLSTSGVTLAISSGAVTSGLGYVVWYRALKSLTATEAGVVQLAVPPLAALGGILLLGEIVTPRFIGASAVILIGIALALIKRRPYVNSK